MSGTITTRTFKDVERLLEENPGLKTIEMIKVPGSANDESNLKASRLIRNAGIDIHVPKGGYIASGGVDFFCAGITRTAHEDSYFGVHSWADDKVESAHTLPKEHPDHQIFLDYYREMDIPDDFYWFTLRSAIASEMYNMSPNERVQYGLIKK